MGGERRNLMTIKIADYQVSVIEALNLIANESRLGENSPFLQQIKWASGLTKQQKMRR